MNKLHQRDIENEILELLKQKDFLPIKKIAEQLNITQSLCNTCIKELVEQEKLIKIPAKNSGQLYYAVHKGGITAEEFNNLRDVIVKDTVDVKDAYEELSEEIEKIGDSVNGLYANMISIISIFVAIFALIIVNANIAFKLTQENKQDIFIGIIITNIFVVVCIIALLVSVKFIIINPILRRKKRS